MSTLVEKLAFFLYPFRFSSWAWAMVLSLEFQMALVRRKPKLTVF